MADANTEIDLDAVHQAIVDGLAAAFPDIAVSDHPTERTTIRAPACFVELAELERADPEDDPGSNQLPMIARYEARLVFGFRRNEPKRAIRKAAAAMAAAIHLQRWGLPIGPADVQGAYRDDFSPELDQYEIWRIEWEHAVDLGDTVWTNDGTVPSQVLYSWEPETGSEFEPEYKPLPEQWADPANPPYPVGRQSIVVRDDTTPSGAPGT